MYCLIPLVGFFAAVHSYPWVVDVAGVDSSFLEARRHKPRQQPSPNACPFNADHQPAAPITDEYPYNGAKNGQKGNGQGGYQVPAPGDDAHKFVAPGPNDIRGPCPGLNTAANHNFLAHDGIVTFNELVDAQQNVYNVGHDLAVLLAALGLTLTDGDIVTEKLSLGCDATERTSINPVLTGSEPGLNGHNKFEADTSLTRNDLFLGGDNYSFNRTLFDMMQDTCQGSFNRENLALYRYQRYQQSIKDNKNFYYGPLSLLLYGAASFLYELMPNGNHNYAPDLETITSFFVDEKIPDNWINRKTPYTNNDVTNEILAQYLLHPVLFGGNTADGSFDTINFGNSIKNGTISPGIDPTVTSCLIYQLATERIPGYANGVLTPTVEALQFVLTRVFPDFQNLGCAAPLT